MSDTIDVLETESAAATRGVSIPWVRLCAGSGVLTLTAALLGAVAMKFVQNRPENYCALSTYFVETLEDALQQHYIPEGGIQRSGPSLRQDAAGSILFYDVAVRVPPQLDAQHVAKLIEERMHRSRVDVAPIPMEDAAAAVALSVMGREFARVSFRQEAAPPPREPSDLRAACYRIARGVRDALVELGIPARDIIEAEASEARDEEAIWAVSAMQAALPEGLGPEDVFSCLEAYAEPRNAAVEMYTGLMEERIIEVSYAGRPCVRLTCVAQFAAGGVQPSQADLSEVIEISLPAYEELPLDSAGMEEGEAESAMKAEPEGMPAAPEAEAPLGRLGIILDDGGYHSPDNEPALELDHRVTLAVLPNAPYSGTLSAAAANLGFEVMLHMPMENHSETYANFPGQLTTNMDDAEIRRHTEDALDQIDSVAGVNNHTGSVFTSDAERMAPFLEVVKERGLFFVDSLTASTSQAYETAAEMGVAAGVRDVFLDNDSDPKAIRRQFEELLGVVRRQGYAVGIGHFRTNTVAVLSEVLPELEERGVELVPMSELVQ